MFETTDFNDQTLAKRFKEMAYLNPTITIKFKDERHGFDETYHFEGGIKQFVEDLNKKEAVSQSRLFLRLHRGHRSRSRLHVQRRLRRKSHELRQQHPHPRWRHPRSGISHGSHQNHHQIRRSQRQRPEKDNKISGDDVREGLIAIVSVKVMEPQFEGQTKGNSAAPSSNPSARNSPTNSSANSSKRSQRRQSDQ